VKRTIITLTAVATLGAAAYIGSQLRADPQPPGQVQQTSATAPAAPPRTRVAMVNLAQVLRNYEKWQNYERTFKEYLDKLRVDFEGMKKPGLQIQESLSKLSPEDKEGREKLQQQLRDIQRHLQDYEEGAKKNMAKYQDDALVVVYRDIHDAVASYARANDIEMVFHFSDAINQTDLYSPANVERKMKSAGCIPLYVTPGMDISDIVVANLNARLHSGAPTGAQQ